MDSFSSRANPSILFPSSIFVLRFRSLSTTNPSPSTSPHLRRRLASIFRRRPSPCVVHQVLSRLSRFNLEYVYGHMLGRRHHIAGKLQLIHSLKKLLGHLHLKGCHLEEWGTSIYMNNAGPAYMRINSLLSILCDVLEEIKLAQIKLSNMAK